jgi:hypothetical protein
MAMRRLVRAGLTSVAAIVAACGSTTSTPPAGDTTPPVVSVSGTGGELRGSFSASASDGQSSITAHRLYLNGTLVRSGASGAALTVTDTTLAPGSYTVRGEANSSGGTGSNSTTFTVTAPVVPSLTIAPVTFPEDGQATSTLTAQNCTTPVYTLGAPTNPSYQPTLAGNTLTHKFAPDANGTGSVPVNVTCANGNATATAQATITPMSDFEFRLAEMRSDSTIKTPATLNYRIGSGATQTLAAVNGVFKGQVTPGNVTWLTVDNTDTFNSDRLENGNGTLIGINWKENDGVTQNLASDMTAPSKIKRLAKQGSPYGSLAEMMRIYSAVWTPTGEHVVPVFPQATIRIYTGAANANWGFTRAPTADELATITQGAIDTRNKFQTPDYQIKIDTSSAALPATAAELPEGIQLIGIGVNSSNAVLRNANGKIVGGSAQVFPGFGQGVVRDELYEMHVGQRNEDLQNGNTFFGANNQAGIIDLTAGDIDIVQYVNNTLARDAEKKRLANGGSKYVLKQ